MSDAPGGQQTPPSHGMVRSRLVAARWTLAAALLAIAAVAASNGSWPVAVLGAGAVMAAAAYAPRRRRAERTAAAAAAAHGPMQMLHAADLAAAVPDPLIVFDMRGTIVHVNPAAAVAFAAVAPGIALQLAFRTPEMHGLIEAVVADPARVQPVDYAERVPIERVFRVFAAAVGRDTGLFALVFKDQSETRRIDRMRADFIANASHELRTPLASIGGFVETLRGPARNDPVAREKFLSIMQEQTRRMARLIDDLLSLSRLEMKAAAPAAAPVRLDQVIAGVISSLAPLAKESGVAVETRIAEAPLTVAGDRDELFQVFENLLENAIKYGEAGGRVVVEARMAGGPEPDEVEVVFRDFGPGIAEEHIPRITERFYRVDTGHARKGTGLGLAIVKHILTRHGGRLEVRSMLGEGSVFTAHVPVRRVRSEPPQAR